MRIKWHRSTAYPTIKSSLCQRKFAGYADAHIIVANIKIVAVVSFNPHIRATVSTIIPPNRASNSVAVTAYRRKPCTVLLIGPASARHLSHFTYAGVGDKQGRRAGRVV